MATFNHGPTLFAVAFVLIILIHQTYFIYTSASPMATFNRGQPCLPWPLFLSSYPARFIPSISLLSLFIFTTRLIPIFADGLLPPSPWPFLSHPGSVPWFFTLVLHLGSPCLQWLPSIAVDPGCRGHCSCHLTLPDLSRL